MDKGRVFISSTIYDFADLRSSLKYWLSEMGYDVYMSESRDFPRDAAENSYQTCLSTIEKCDWFILLIGDRVGGTFFDRDSNQTISITRKEYRVAYSLFEKGKIKKIITFVRHNVWIAKEERKDILKNVEGQDVSTLINNTPSKNADIPPAIFGFIDEVRRIPEMSEANKGKTAYPRGNWVNTFTSFSDIVSTLRIEFGLFNDTSVLIWKANISEEIKQNLKKLVVRNSSGFFGMFSTITRIRDDCVSQLKENGRRTVTLSISDCQIIGGTFITTTKLNSIFMKESLLAGHFLRYNADTNTYETTAFSKSLALLVELIERNGEQSSFFIEGHSFIAKTFDMHRNDKALKINIPYADIAPILAEHDILSNILSLSLYVIKQLSSSTNIAIPTLYPTKLVDNFDYMPPEKKELFASYDEFYGKEITDEDLNVLLSTVQNLNS